MIEWIKREKIPLLTTIIFGCAQAILHASHIFSFSLNVTLTQILIIFSLSSIIAHQYSWKDFNQQNIMFVIISAISPIILMQLTLFLYINVLPKSLFSHSSILIVMMTSIYQLVLLYCLLLPSLLFVKFNKHQPNAHANNSAIQKHLVIIFSGSMYILIAQDYVGYLFSISLSFVSNSIDYIYYNLLIIIALVYLYLWYQPSFSRHSQQVQHPFTTLNACVLIVGIPCLILKIPAIMAFALFIFLGGNVIGLALVFGALILSFLVSPTKAYKIFHGCIILAIVILVLTSGNIHSPDKLIFRQLSLILATFAFATLIFGSFSRFMLKISLKISQNIV